LVEIFDPSSSTSHYIQVMCNNIEAKCFAFRCRHLLVPFMCNVFLHKGGDTRGFESVYN
jgi:hypothetical protein